LELIDLGAEVTFNVKIGSAEYKLSEPSVLQVAAFRDELKQDEDKSIECFLSLVTKLGMPKEVAESLGVSKLAILAESLTKGVSKKK